MAKNKTDISIYGKVPPQAKELEEYVLGSILMEPQIFDAVSELLNDQCFYVENNQRIFHAFMKMSLIRMPIEILTVVEYLKQSEELDLVGGPYAITKLTNSVVSTANIETHCRIILQKYLQRELIRIGGEMVNNGYEDSADAFDQLDQAERNITEVAGKITVSDYFGIESELTKVVTKLYSLRDVDTTISGIPSGYKEIDRIIHGWQPSDLIILAARPSVGKTAIALNFVRNACNGQKNRSVGVFSLEMSGNSLAQRMLSAESEVFLESIRTGKLGNDWDGKMEKIYDKGVMVLSDMKIFIDDTAGVNMFHIRSRARKMVRKQGVSLIVIDYLQLIQGSNSKAIREQQVSEISRDLKILAKELKVPIICLSQLSRDVEKRGSEEPRLSDLRESGAIEQDADIVIFLWKPSDIDVEKNSAEKYIRYYKIAKHREGSLDKNVLAWYPEIQKFKNKDDPAPAYITGSNWIPVKQTNIVENDDDKPF